MSDEQLNLTQTLDAIREDTDGRDIHVPELMDALNSRGFGPFLIGPALISVLPTGAIPGGPEICSVLIIFVSAQILIGRAHPWLPKKWVDFSFKRKKFLDALEKAKPYTKKIDKYLHPRLKSLTSTKLKPVIALQIIVLSIAVIILGLVPFAASLPAAGILLFGLGLSVRDGLLILIATFFTAASAIALPMLWGTIFG